MKNINVLCLNCFGIPVFVHKTERFNLLAEELHRLEPDIIALQEVFVWSNRNTLIQKLKDSYNYFPHKYSSFSSGGLLVFVKKAIKVTKFRFDKFKNQGNKSLISIPDGIAGKGYQVLNLSVDSKTVNLVNSQLMCQYYESEYLKRSHVDQITELGKVINEFDSNYNIVVGDLNSRPISKSIRSFCLKLGLYEKLTQDDYTVDVQNLNRGEIMNLWAMGDRFRVDYTLVSKPLTILDQKIIFSKPLELNGKYFHISDHFGILTQIQL